MRTTAAALLTLAALAVATPALAAEVKYGAGVGKDQEFQAIKIKVDDGVMVFPLDAKGKTATAEGTFTRIEVPAERVAEMKKHDAEEKGIPFDPKSVKGAEVIYRIDGTGAVVR
jgi:hypothetical protein